MRRADKRPVVEAEFEGTWLVLDNLTLWLYKMAQTNYGYALFSREPGEKWGN